MLEIVVESPRARHLGGVWYHELGRRGLGTRSGSLVRTKGAIDDMLDSAPCTLVQLDTSGGYTMQIYQNQSMYMPSTSIFVGVRCYLENTQLQAAHH